MRLPIRARSLVAMSALLHHSRSLTLPAAHLSSVTLMNSAVATQVDQELMTTPGFSIDQLMELAGLAVATAAMETIDWKAESANKAVLVACGPGNNGGDGLVAARHLKHFGLLPTVLYPKQNKDALFANLVQQCTDLDIPLISEAPPSLNDFALVVDALFGFSFKGPPRQPFTDIIAKCSRTTSPVLSVDVPSGWDVERGDVFDTSFTPYAVISLTLPKECMRSYQGMHFIGGR